MTEAFDTPITDHVPMDLLVVDERGGVLGRPWMTIAIDPFTRAIVACHVALRGDGAATA